MHIIVNLDKGFVKDAEAALVRRNSRATLVLEHCLEGLAEILLVLTQGGDDIRGDLGKGTDGVVRKKLDLDLGNGGKGRARRTRSTLVRQGSLEVLAGDRSSQGVVATLAAKDTARNERMM